MGKRQEARFGLQLPVRIWGMDTHGQMFEAYATTIDVTTKGARITSVPHELHRGAIVGVEYKTHRARYRVAWIRNDAGRSPGEIGLQLVDVGKFIWGRVLPRVFGDPDAPSRKGTSDDE